MIKIGVLALQGAFREHINALRKCNVEAVEVKLPKDLENIDVEDLSASSILSETEEKDKNNFVPILSC